MIRAIDLFAGGGGSSLGAKHAGINIVAAFDFWGLAERSHQENFPETRFFCDRIECHDVNVLSMKLGKIDMILASPECTNHSPAKGNKPRCEESKDTAFQVIRFAKAFRPRWIIIENVISMRNWSRYGEFFAELKSLGYRMREQVLNSADFGVPQSRRRLFLMCDLKNEPEPILKKIDKFMNIGDIVDLGSTYSWSPLKTPRRAAGTLERADRAIHALGKNEPFILVYYGSDKSGGWQDLSRPLRTITTIDRFAIVRPSSDGHEIRMLQVPELQMAMGMGEIRLAHGSRREKVKILGNAVCPPVMKAIIEKMTGLTNGC